MMFAETVIESPGFWIMLVPSIATLIFAIAGWINAQRASILGTENKMRLEQVGKDVDGKMEKLLHASTMAARAEGQIAGRDAISAESLNRLDLASIAADELLARALVVANARIVDAEAKARDLQEKARKETAPDPPAAQQAREP